MKNVYKLLNEIVEMFAANDVIFEIEDQFKFNLAWEIRKRLSEKEYEVLLEKRLNKHSGACHQW